MLEMEKSSLNRNPDHLRAEIFVDGDLPLSLTQLHGKGFRLNGRIFANIGQPAVSQSGWLSDSNLEASWSVSSYRLRSSST